ncbi:MAG: transglutaminase-like domain-containing protein [Propionibacteriaceae bacterium]|jgi:hypothetical protein|nr:transglutaminase-like domain-containing protein [Propionibacteriaceae bacterium]
MSDTIVARPSKPQRAIDPDEGRSGHSSIGLSTSRRTGARQLLPDAPRLIDAAAIAALTLLGLLGLASTFDSWHFLIVSAIGAFVGLIVAQLVSALHWPGWLSPLLAVAVYFLLGGLIAIRRDLLFGLLPSTDTWATLTDLAVGGWKDLLTTMPPVPGAGPFLALPFLLALLASASSFALAGRARSLVVGLIPQVALFALVIAIGAKPAWWPWLAAMLWLAVALAWMVQRSARRAPASQAGRAAWSGRRLLIGALILALAGAGGWLVGPVLTTGVSRQILRDVIEPPIELNDYPSPMPSFRKYSSSALADTYFYNSSLIQVDGAQKGELIRFAVLDSYDGWVWGAADGAFQRVGSVISTPDDPTATAGEPRQLTVTIGQVYADQTPLNVWLPSLGYAQSIDFSGGQAQSHAQSMGYDLTKGQAVVLDQLAAGDVIHQSAWPIPLADPEGDYSPAGPALVDASRTAFLPDQLQDVTIEGLTGGQVTPWAQLQNMAASFRQGGWTDGTTRAGDADYLPGDGQARLTSFLATMPAYAGSDEQYAATFALMANRIGFPARVVFGARMTADGDIRGRNVTIWVEIHTTQGWLALDPEFFIPDRDKVPDPPPPVVTDPPQEVPDIADPQAGDPPDELNAMDTQAETTPRPPAVPEVTPWWVYGAVSVGSVLGLVAILAGILLAIKAIRLAWRRSRGTPLQQINAGYNELLDRAIDLKLPVPPRRGAMTRREQAAISGQPELIRMASLTDALVWGPTAPDGAAAQGYWQEVLTSRAQLLDSRPAKRRWWPRLTPRSLRPRRR